MYAKLSSIAFKELMTYRLYFFVGIISAFIQLIVLWYVWNSVFASSAATIIGGFTLSSMITYVVISSALRSYLYFELEFRIEDHVKTGFITNLITKPWNYFGYNFFLEMGYLAFNVITRALPMIFVGFVFLGISLPSNPVGFLISIILGCLITYALSFLTGLWSFWTSGSIWGFRFARQVISDVLSGALIPLSLFPIWLSNIASFLPFQAVYYLPISIYVGNITGFGVLTSLAVQIFWVAILFSLCFLGWKRAERRIVSHGG